MLSWRNIFLHKLFWLVNFSCTQMNLLHRQIERQLNMPAEKKKSRLLQKVTDTNPLNIGIIGCGRLGKHIADCLLSYGEVSPDYLTISTRRPETLSRSYVSPPPRAWDTLAMLKLWRREVVSLSPDRGTIVGWVFTPTRQLVRFSHQNSELILFWIYCLHGEAVTNRLPAPCHPL